MKFEPPSHSKLYHLRSLKNTRPFIFEDQIVSRLPNSPNKSEKQRIPSSSNLRHRTESKPVARPFLKSPSGTKTNSLPTHTSEPQLMGPFTMKKHMIYRFRLCIAHQAINRSIVCQTKPLNNLFNHDSTFEKLLDKHLNLGRTNSLPNELVI